jgi:hypothetical protein
MTVIRAFALVAALLLAAPVDVAFAQEPAPVAEAKPEAAAPAPAQEDDPDRDVNLAQPDFTLVALPTTLRLPRHKSAFRISHRFGRALGSGDFGDLLADAFGLDNGAFIGFEYRFGLFRGTQLAFHRTSDKTIQFLAQYDLRSQSTFPVGLNVIGAIEGSDNLGASTPDGGATHYSPSLGLLLSREVGQRASLYVEPIWVNNSNPDPGELADDNSTLLLGLGARVRVRPTVYLVLEGSPRVSGFDPGVTQVSFGIEKRWGGHLFQLNVSNGFGTTFAQLARGGFNNDDWYLGFNISRKFF